ncbi:release factor glutamine methyltransferase [Tenacibaculum sp. MAR_2009_124]|uniref:peptide chain release factor N(5)-glutamine methyltransferase n=1 Tax=Tenacibaculum sp. MAR_2009_124 TaxID=1250059 RepID=UPI000896FC90|nr:peptide chain release factor N(5)-glutamine methyltransferase [Tenacibaculum sp. MAR_2009_124]SEB43593.1 release factor glutamine methyltransferase [Tenacibaculum sp. MAR_2009_124]
MTIKELKSLFSEELSSIYPKTEIDTFFYITVEEYLNFKRIDTVLQPHYAFEKDIEKDIIQVLHRLKREEPIQYIIGKTEFYGLTFNVNNNTLIPRPETEELVQWIIEEAHNFDKEIKILDIGTGSGCIPISLKVHLPNAKVSTIDVSPNAIDVAKQNAFINEVKVDFMNMDILESKGLPDTYDIIVSNPPYVRELEKEEIKNNVLLNEPHLALFVENDAPLIFYDKISKLASKHLNKEGILFFEINQYLGKETSQLIKNNGFESVELRKDLFGNYRMTKATL